MLATFRTQLQIVQPFTNQAEEIVHALDQVETVGDSHLAFGAFAQLARKVRDSAFGAGGLREMVLASVSEGKVFQSTVENQISALCESIAALSRFLRPMPGRKSIVLYSTGYLLQPHQITRELIDRRFGRFTGGFGATRQQVNAMLSGLQGVPLTHYLDTAIDHANLSQVAVYAIDPRGLVSDALSQELRELDLQTDTFSSFYRDALTAAPRQFLDYISARSGGLALGNQNDMASVLRQALADSQGYYLLSYRPGTARKAGKAHRIDLRVKRPGVSTLYRKSYRELDPAIVLRGDVLAAFQYPDLFRGYPLRLELSFQEGQMYVKTMVPSEAVRFVREAGGFRGRVEVYSALFDSSGAWLGQELFFSKTQDLIFSRERKEELQGYDNVSLTAVADPPAAGKYRLGVVVRQGADGSMSTIQQPLLWEK